jgi:hypothetical protein
MDEWAERNLLLKNIEDDKGTLEEQEIWLARFQILDPHFQSDYILSLRDLLKGRYKAQTLREEFGSPRTREQLIALVQSIDYSKAENGEEIEDMDARSLLFAESVPHPRAEELLGQADQSMSAEEVVDMALSWKVPNLFCLPGTQEKE